MNELNQANNRERVGLVFRPDEWMGGTYYIINLVNALNYLETSKKPLLIIFTNNVSDFNYLQSETGYPFMEMVLLPETVKISFWKRMVNRIFFFKRRPFSLFYNQRLDILYPFSYHPFLAGVKNKVTWIPDLQDKYYPEFFNRNECEEREANRKTYLRSGRLMVFSSVSAKNDFEKFYKPENWNSFVMHFASVPGKMDFPTEEYIRNKYKLTGPFFYSPNQFWKHKNHEVVIRAAHALLQQGITTTIVFSGKENDPRNPQYTADLKALVKEWGMESNVLFCGFIDRTDVFALMKYSVAVLQPSLFEGWSTVIEDALTLQAPLVISDIPVNREQAGECALYFDAVNHLSLSTALKTALNKQLPAYTINHHERVKAYANRFLQLITYTKQVYAS